MTILIVCAALYVFKELLGRYDSIKKEDPSSEPAARSEVARPPAQALAGLPPSLENAHQTAEKQGAGALKNFLIGYRQYLRDPKLADIELDYVVLVSRQDPAEAKRVFQAVKERTPLSSPVYPRIKSLEKTYQ